MERQEICDMFTNEEADEVESNKDPLAGLDMAYVKESQKLYDSLTSQFTISMAKAASKRERDEKQMKSMNLVYGEITFESMGIILEKIKKRYGKPYVGTSGSGGVLQQSCGGIFYDLGSGSGKSTIAAAVLHNFEMCWGIEQLEGLYSMSLDLNNAYEQKGKSKLLGREKDTDIQFMNGDLLNLAFKDWRDGDVIFCNSTCFDEQLMNKFCDRAMELKKGTFVITITKRMTSALDFTVIEHEMHPMSWGQATVYIQQKITEPHKAKDVDSDDEGEQ